MTILTLFSGSVEADDENMTTDLLPRSASRGHRFWDRWLARAYAPSLDSQLAAGWPPGTSRLLAIRAQEITSPAGRGELVRGWGYVLSRARRPAVPRTPRAPLCRDRIAAAEGDVRTMLAVLACPLPISARGAAMASVLLGDGTGPLHNHHSTRDLTAAVRDATREMKASFSRL
ncbi:MAG TPA: hypothetical protein VE464_03720 [Streptosporangiaceae bacterium]|nr:hypothetical protein [Streptosporangiaceae bacterium]